MTGFEVKTVYFNPFLFEKGISDKNTDNLRALLAAGWEPFAITKPDRDFDSVNKIMWLKQNCVALK